MPKPTLKQRLLGQPSTSYATAPNDNELPYWTREQQRRRRLATSSLASGSTATLPSSSSDVLHMQQTPDESHSRIQRELIHPADSNVVRTHKHFNASVKPASFINAYPTHEHISHPHLLPAHTSTAAHDSISVDEILALHDANINEYLSASSSSSGTEEDRILHDQLSYSSDEGESVYYTPPATPAPLRASLFPASSIPSPAASPASPPSPSTALTSKSTSTMGITMSHLAPPLASMRTKSTETTTSVVTRSSAAESDKFTTFSWPSTSDVSASTHLTTPSVSGDSGKSLRNTYKATPLPSGDVNAKTMSESQQFKHNSISASGTMRNTPNTPSSMPSTSALSPAQQAPPSMKSLSAEGSRWLTTPQRTSWTPPVPPPSHASSLSRHHTIASSSFPVKRSNSGKSRSSSKAASMRNGRNGDVDGIAGPTATFGIPFTHPDTGLPMLDSIISVSRQSLGSIYSDNSSTHSVNSLDSSSSDGAWSGHSRHSGHSSSGRRTPSRSSSRTMGLREQMSFIIEEDESEGTTVGVVGGVGMNGERSFGSTRSAPSSSRARIRTNSLPTNSSRQHHQRSKSSSSIVAEPVGSSNNISRRPPSSSKKTASIYSTATGSSQKTYNSYQTSSRTVELPSPLPSTHGLHSPPSNAYGSLILARAEFSSSASGHKKTKGGVVSSVIDITKSGLAQTVMASIEVQRGAALYASSHSHSHSQSHSMTSLLLGVGKKSKSGTGGLLTSSSKEAPTPAHLLAKAPVPLGFSSRTPPPSKLISTHVLVQVFMVGLDGIDALVVADKVKGGENGYGFVPGRSFVGRAVEVGYEVRSVCKGDWVFGLLDLGKSGALAEFITVHYRRLHRAPDLNSTGMSLAQIALFPLCGIPAHRAMQTLPLNDTEGNERKTALVMNAHDGTGSLLVQMLNEKGVHVTAQVPPQPPHHIEDGEDGDGNDEPGEGVAPVPQMTYVEIARYSGAKDVVIGEPLVAIAELSEASFDFVLDTIGGRRIWEASKWIMRTGGQFTTLVGDDTTSPPYTTHSLKSNLRSIRTAMKRSSKSISYEWIIPNAELATEGGEDVRDSLAALVEIATSKSIRPWPKWAVPFEQTPQAFKEGRGLFKNGGVVVSRVLG